MTRYLTALIAATIVGLAAGATPAAAATPDGAAGPWSDGVVALDQGRQADGRRPRSSRRDGRSALGPAEDTSAESTFVSLGFGGVIVLALENPVCDQAGPDLRIVEATRGIYDEERGQVDVSADGSNWTPALRALRGSYDGELPDNAGTVRFVRITDVTDPSLFDGDADGFDVDGVAALHPTGPCTAGTDGNDPTLALPASTPTPVPAAGGTTGGGSGSGSTTVGQIGILGVRTQVCGSQRKFSIRLRVPKRFTKRLRSVRVRVAGKRVPVRFRKGRYRATVDLRGVKRGRYTIKVRMVDRKGRVANETRRYMTCRPGPTG